MARRPVCLESFFNHVGNGKGTKVAITDEDGLFAGYGDASNVDIQRQVKKWNDGIKNIPVDESHVNALLDLFEDCFAVIPAFEEDGRADVSLFTETKVLAALASCFLIGEQFPLDESNPFVLFTLDFSGIQSFIYTITSSGALRSLRTRSFYLSIMTEYISDLVLEASGLTRANLIYSGGGRAQFLLPSVDSIIGDVTETVARVNEFLRSQFGAALYLAYGWEKTSGAVLAVGGDREFSLSNLFVNVSKKVIANQLCRYSYAELTELNSADAKEGERECSICGNTNHLIVKEDRCLCSACYAMEQFAAEMGEDHTCFCVVKGNSRNGLPLPSVDETPRVLVAGNVETAAKAERTYMVNASDETLPDCVRISLSRHQAKLENGRQATFEDLARDSEGIRRLGVLRADVDNLGVLFAEGFVQKEKRNPYSACTLARYSALSFAMTWFFQRNLDHILDQADGAPTLQAKPNAQNVSVVYAGGDDVFLIGGWNDVLAAGLKIQEAFEKYTKGNVTLSAGFSVFGEHAPVPIMADATAELESDAKHLEGKNGIALFGKVLADASMNDNYCYHWDYFRSSVVTEKIALLEQLFNTLPDKGNSFLYHILSLFREMTSSPTAISRLAYLLARHVPSKNEGATGEQIQAYKDFENKVYTWAIWSRKEIGKNDPLKRQEVSAFEMACLIYVYLHRERDSERA
ncbi:MAG: type III-A CRISPR-associated protein Cas10/Csm1 [Clostridia bacterium]|nr:type III-A CRISPR-associated protein Cas10/Csm1 [Clostridia bacterium]